MTAHFYKEKLLLTYFNTYMYKCMAHTTLGVKIYAPNHYLKTILEGLDEICKTAKCRSFRVAATTQELEMDGEG